MSTRQQGEWLGDAVGEGHKDPAALSNQQSSDTAEAVEEVRVRRSWRPCQMLGQDSHHPHHHHHHPHHPPIPHQGLGRGHPRHRRRPPSGQGPTRLGEGVEMDPSSHTQPPRLGVSRYRRQGEPRVRVHRQRQPTEQGDPTGPAAMKQQPPPCSPQAHHPLESGATDLTGGTRLSPSDHTISPHTPDPPCQDLPAPVPDAVSPQAEEEEEEEEEEGCSSSITLSVSIQTGFDRETDQENQREGVRGEEDLHQTALGVENGEEDEEGDTNGLCSDTESSASLSMDVPPLSPPGHQSPPVSPSPFSPPPLQSEHSDQCSDEFSPSPAHENDIVPDSESRADSPLSTSESFTNSYPKTYAEFYNESYPQSESMTEPFTESFTEPYTKSYPQSFPKPLKMVCYPDSDRESHKGSEANSDEPFSESCSEPFSVRRKGRVYQEAGDIEPQPHSAWSGGVAGSTRNLPHWRGRSVGSRLHHYDDATSDGEGESLKDGPRNLGLLPRDVEGEAQSERASSGQPGSVGATEELVGAELTPPLEGHSEDWVRGSGDAVSLAIRDIREAIEEVKTKTVRSPYTPDQPVQPVWVMRQEVSPSEEECYSQQPLGNGVHPFFQSSHYKPVPLPDPVPVQVPVPVHVPVPEPVCPVRAESSRIHQVQQRLPSIEEIRRNMPAFPTYVEVPGPCDPEDLIDGIIFAASYLGSTHLLSERTPSKSARMLQAQEAMGRVRTAQKQAKNRKTESEVPSSTEVDLFMSTQRIKVLNADSQQESMMDLPLRTISYIADLGSMVVLMARGKMVRSRSAQEHLNHTAEQPEHTLSPARDDRRQYRMVCHVFESEDAQLIAQSIGQAFSVAYQEFLRANGIDPEDLSQREYSDLLNTQDMYNDDLIHFSKSENCRDVYIEKLKGEMLGVVIVESGWGSILPTVIVASMMHSGPAEKSGRLNVGDQIMTINGTSLVGLPLSTCQSIIKGLKAQSRIKLNIVRCPPVTMVLIRRPDLRYQLGFSVQNGIICSLMRGGIAERGGVRVGHRIIEINGQSVVATPHEKIVHILSNAVGEIHMKTMPAAMYRLLTAQEQPVYI
ncbi:amyloid-beta A4 precursor protein-binding family A member 1 isoform X1 [Esox lucius]|uniref:Amyloid beta precursor protein binding family A member 1 n=1 Tax=Esox lucius TaxID=8010 RepID=A0A3P8ZY63_ESOLU|nr:amyloid-beta A4 precursor protein-binding family A member 1 isoform X1 [Esox lucius]XP_010876185.2 amyloid-beta A4 precursor protein-binding family A member 1 isoform X1 [Esox lucius]XP_010876186.2 amyloid-beta A4 precursor protein-binding family A member 1 isoform X1 [Esox lucius]XP_010876188.2 amyloid-beta A4 precursor protein-binding family A member 1 isoform X1 [Esox lucius]